MEQAKGQLGSHLDVIDAKDGIEFVVCAVKEAHLDQVRAKLASAGLEEVAGGDTNVASPVPKPVSTQVAQGGGPRRQQGARGASGSQNAEKLKPRPYRFRAASRPG